MLVARCQPVILEHCELPDQVWNQRADNVTVFRVARKSGGLTFTGHYTAVGNPSVIVFRDLAKGS